MLELEMQQSPLPRYVKCWMKCIRVVLLILHVFLQKEMRRHLYYFITLLFVYFP